MTDDDDGARRRTPSDEKSSLGPLGLLSKKYTCQKFKEITKIQSNFWLMLLKYGGYWTKVYYEMAKGGQK